MYQHGLDSIAKVGNLMLVDCDGWRSRLEFCNGSADAATVEKQRSFVTDSYEQLKGTAPSEVKVSPKARSAWTRCIFSDESWSK